MIMFCAIMAEKIFSDCFSHLFILSSHFNSRLRVMNLRGFSQLGKETLTAVLRACKQIAHLDLSYCKLVDDELIEEIGSLYKNTLISLSVRSCHQITDSGIIEMCENFSGAKALRKEFPNPKNDTERYKELRRLDLETSTVQFLNIADIKALTNRSMKSITTNLMYSLRDLCIWSDYHITNDGILDLCLARNDSKFNRINYCGCYKISDDARLWFSTSFKQPVINYIRIEEFGKDIDYGSYIDPTTKKVIYSAKDKDVEKEDD